MPRVGKSMDRKRNARRSANNGALTAAQWNSQFSIGTRVRAYPIIGDEDTAFNTKTRSEAWTLGDGSAVVLIEGRTGGYYLNAIKAIAEPRPA